MSEKQTKTGLREVPELEIGIVETKTQLIEAEIEPQSLQFRIEIRRRPPLRKILRFLAVFLFFIALAGLSAALRFKDDFREDAIVMVKQLAKAARTQKFSHVTRPVLAHVSQILKAHRPPKAEIAEEPVTNTSGTCAAFITDALNKKVKTAVLSEGEFLHLVNCELFQDSPRTALQSLEKKHIGLASGSTWEGMPLNLLVLEANRRMHPLSPLPIFAKQGCLRWSSLPDCLMRYVDESRASYKSRWQDGFKALEKDVLKQAPSVQAWFYNASSLYATKDREYSKADGYLQMAFNAIKDEPNPYLEREIYRNGTINAYLAKDQNLTRKALTLMPMKRMEEAPTAFLDVELLGQLKSKDAKQLLASYLNQAEAQSRFGGDPRFINIILNQTQKFELEKEGLDLAMQLFGNRSEAKPETIGESMVLAYARMWIGAGKSFEALEILTQMEKSGYRSPELYHLKGLAQLFAFKKPEIKLLAAKDFQTAAGLNKSEESLFALLIALLDAKERNKADQVMSQWKGLGPAAQKSVWFGFAQGLVSYTGGNKDQALSIWEAAEKSSSNNPLWAKLKANISTDSTYLDRDLAKTLSSLLTNDSPLGSLALIGQKS